MQHFVLRCLPRPSRQSGTRCRTFHDASIVTSIKWVRDRGLDHAVEKERDLKPVLNVTNLIYSEPSRSLPLSIISDNKLSLGIPTRPMDFIRKYPSVFEEFLPGGIGIHPHVKLTPQILTLNAQEQLLFQSEIQKQDVADRLLKLLMIARINKIPLCVIDRLKWDLGLPNDYTQSVVPQFPDYFQVTSNGKELELVCWIDELAVSVMEKRSMTSFPLQYSRGFEMDKKFKKWVDDWQKLPYISPYENALHLQANSDESDKWAVGLLHEILHLLVPRKTEKDNLLFLGEYLGVRSRFKRALLQHPGVFYVSSKLGSHTVVLREAYTRDLLVSKPPHPLMELRSNYIHLMNTVKEEKKSKSMLMQVNGSKKQKAKEHLNEGEEEESKDDTQSGHEDDETDSEVEGITDSDSNADQIENPTRKMRMEGRDPFKRTCNMPVQNGRSRGGTSGTVKFNHNDSARRNTFNSRGGDNDGKGRGRGGTSRNRVFDSGTSRMSDRRRGTRQTSPPRFLRPEVEGAQKSRLGSTDRSGVSRARQRRC